MRLKLFEWTEKTFGYLSPGSLINYNEMISEKIAKIKNEKNEEEKAVFRINEITMTIKMIDAPNEFLNSEIHVKWKKEIEEILNPEEFDRLGFEVSGSFKSITPNDVEIIKGIPKGILLRKYPLSITLNFFKKRKLIINNPQEK